MLAQVWDRAELVAKITAGAGSDFLGAGGADVGATRSTFVVAAAGPGIGPDGVTMVALIPIEERGLAAGLFVKLMTAFGFFFIATDPAQIVHDGRRGN